MRLSGVLGSNTKQNSETASKNRLKVPQLPINQALCNHRSGKKNASMSERVNIGQNHQIMTADSATHSSERRDENGRTMDQDGS